MDEKDFILRIRQFLDTEAVKRVGNLEWELKKYETAIIYLSVIQLLVNTIMLARAESLWAD